MNWDPIGTMIVHLKWGSKDLGTVTLPLTGVFVTAGVLVMWLVAL